MRRALCMAIVVIGLAVLTPPATAGIPFVCIEPGGDGALPVTVALSVDGDCNGTLNPMPPAEIVENVGNLVRHNLPLPLP